MNVKARLRELLEEELRMPAVVGPDLQDRRSLFGTDQTTQMADELPLLVQIVCRWAARAGSRRVRGHP